MNPTRTMRRQRGGVGSIPVRVMVDEAPCTLDPTYWDAPTYRPGPLTGRLAPHEQARVRSASAMCRDCWRLQACAAEQLRNPQDGVIAGHLFIDGTRVPLSDGEAA